MQPHGPTSDHDRAVPGRVRRPHRLLSGLVLLGLVVVPLACGGDDSGGDAGTGAAEKTGADVADPGDSGDDRAARDVIAAKIRENLNGGSTEGAQVTDDQAECVADGAIDALGAERALELSDAEQGDLTADEAERLLPVAKRCVDFAELLAEQILSESEGRISESAADCVAGKLDGSPVMDATLMAALRDAEADPAQDEQLSGLVLEAVSGCLSPEDLQKLGS